MSICDEDRALEFVNGTLTPEEREQYQRHIRFCKPCRDVVDQFRDVASALRAENPDDSWDVPEPTKTTRDAIEEIRARIEAMRHDVRRRADDLLALPASHWHTAVASDRELRTAPFCREIIERAAGAFDQTPTRCRELGVLAVSIAERVCAEAPVPVYELRVEALRDLAYVTRRLGDFDEALRLLADAQETAEQCVEREYEIARIRFSRAIVLTDMQRFQDARAELLEARSTFEEADLRRYVLTFHQESIIHSMTGDFAAAAHTIANVIEQVERWPSRGDGAEQQRELARLYNTAAFAWQNYGDLDAAEEELRKSHAIHLRLGDTAELARDEWHTAAIEARRQRFDEAFAHFASARTKLERLGLVRDLLNLDWDVFEASIASGVDQRALRAQCERLASEAIAARLPVTAADAIAWLRSSASISRELATSVRAFVKSSEAYPSVAFIPPVNAQPDETWRRSRG